jgi:hypothetical protein
MSRVRPDFRLFPKQFVLSPLASPAPAVAGGREESAAGWRVQAAPAVPLVPLEDARGDRVGLLIGWAILGDAMPPDGAPLRLGAEETVKAHVLPELAGRAVCLWRGEGGRGPWLQTDAGGFLPVVFSPGAGLAGATSTLVDLIAPHGVDAEAAAVFDFPRRRGFLPFGLTHHRGVRRLLPGHRLDLGRMTAARVWPSPELCAAPPAAEAEGAALIEGIADRVRAQVGAVARASSPPRLYLSGGRDSRMILAAARAHAGALICETLVNDAPLDLHLAARAAQAAGARHLPVQVIPSPRAEVEAWLRRSGFCFYDPVTELAATAKANDRRGLVMDGTGAEILRASNWTAEDLDADRLTRDVLLRRARLPEAPVVLAEAEAWLDALPPCRATRALDVAKIDLIHGCWAGPSIYGHDIEIPSISPFPSQRNNADALRVPEGWKTGEESYRRWMAHLWPEGLAVPANRAQGLDRLRFLKSELKSLVPARAKRWLKPYR